MLEFLLVPMSPGYIPFHPNPSKPRFKPPAGAVDAHCHVFGPEATFPYAPERKYTPCDAPKEKLFALRDFLGFDKNVIVQASCHSKDNRAMVDALDASSGKAKGVAFVGEEVTDDELRWMDKAGCAASASTFSSVSSTSRRPMCSTASSSALRHSAGTS
jgi:2-pyrone-4,6-dicarboxylate lactonase